MRTEKTEVVVSVPEGFQVDVNPALHTVKVAFQGRHLEKRFAMHNLHMEQKGKGVVFWAAHAGKRRKAMLNTLVRHVQNMIKGLGTPFEYKLKVVHSHFPIQVSQQGKSVLVGNFLGEKKPRKAAIVGAETKVEIKGKDIAVWGPDKDEVGQTAANIEGCARARRKDLRVYQDGVYIVESGIRAK